MTDSVSFLCYSDIHHDEYKNGLTGDDVDAVEEEFYNLIKDLNVDFWVLAGDRFVSRNPLDISRLRADRALKKKNDIGKPGILLPGNHDQYTKNAYSGHSMQNIGLYQKDLNNIYVFNTASTIVLPIKDTSIAIHGIPAGQQIPTFNFDKSIRFNICIFHDMIRGSLYTNGMPSEEGINPELLDNPRFDMVIGGDNHHPQHVKGFKNTICYYIGAPMQHNWGDRGDKRGFLYVKLEKYEKTAYTIKHIESNAPKFIKCEARIESLSELTNMIEYHATIKSWYNSIVNVTLLGRAEVLDTIVPREWAAKIQHMVSAKAVALQLQYDASGPDCVLHEPKSDIDEWHNFIQTSSHNIHNLDPKKLEELGIKYISHA